MRAPTTPGYYLLYDIIRRRSSIRKLKPDPIPDAYSQKIVEAGRWAKLPALGIYRRQRP